MFDGLFSLENSLLFIIFITVLLASNWKLKIFSLNPSLLGAFLFLALFIQIIPGTILVSFFDYPMVMNVQNEISYKVMYITFLYTIISITLLLFLLFVTSIFFNLDVELRSVPVKNNVAFGLTIVSFLVIILKIFSIGSIPLFLAFKGDIVGAGLLKAKILKNESGVGGFLIGYIFVYFPYVSLVYSYIHKQFTQKYSYIFLINLLLIIFYSLYDLQKSKIIIVLFILFVLYLKFNKNIKFTYLVLVPVFSFGILVTTFMLLHGSEVGEVFIAVIARIFIGQTEGAYMMYSVLEPDISRITYGMPLASFFGFSGTDPAAEIVTIFFPTAGTAWVNSNTYIQAHAWSIFGNASIILAPIFVTLNIIGLCVFKGLLSRYIGGYAHSVYIVSILMLPLNNDFSYFLYFKSWLCFSVLVLFYFLLRLPSLFLNVRAKI